MADDPRSMARRIHDALQQIVHEDPDSDPHLNMAGGIVTKFVVGIEVALPDGDRLLYASAAEGMKAWETLGILEMMAATERQGGLGMYRETDGDD